MALNSVKLGGTVKKIGESGFEGCSALMHVALPEGIAEIGQRAFAECPSLQSITLPKSIRSIGTQFVYNDTSLMALKYRGSESQWKNVTREKDWLITTNIEDLEYNVK